MFQKMKGTYDIINDIGYYHAIEKAVHNISRRFNYEEIRTPHFEASELFHRSVGEETDIVSKETYDFTDRGDRDVTLRPEGTAGVVRAYIENKLYASKKSPQKYYYLGSMFRYDRPQKGRTREFRQFGGEAFGSDHPALDAETIAYAVMFLRAIKLKGVNLHINSLGGDESKAQYEKTLKAHVKPHLGELCEDCRRRYEENPLRILDCKVDADHEAIKNAPNTIESLTDDDTENFQNVLMYLDAMGIDYTIDSTLVRGLDYYTHTVYEFLASSELLGAQRSIGGGGRYDKLVEQLGGPATPATGFAFGLERIVHLLKHSDDFTLKQQGIHLYLLTMGERAKPYALRLAHKLRAGGINCETDFLEKSMKAQFKQSAHNKARFVAIIGDEEVEEAAVTLKDQREKSEETISVNHLYEILRQRLRHDKKGA